jgi:hypothetical protein
MSSVVERLLESNEPSVRWKTRVNVLGESRDSLALQNLEQEIVESERTRALVQNLDGQPKQRVGVYAKWQGAQWVLMTLADLGYPRGDSRLRVAATEMVADWLTDRFYNEFEAKTKDEVYARLKQRIPVMDGRYRACASQQGNALHSVMKLGLEDERIHQLAERLLFWQWPDGGWNCDKEVTADTSTFIHTLWAMRGLALYADHTGDNSAREAVTRAAEVFLSRRMFKRASTGAVIRDSFTKLHYPLYWHYDILGGLKVFAEIGLLEDPRLVEALDLLESKQLPDGGWPAEERYYKKVSNDIALGNDYVDWGPVARDR